MQNKEIWVLCGPTASGKSEFAIQLGENLSKKHSSNGFVIINADAMQIYKDIPILTAQPCNTANLIYKLYAIIKLSDRFSIQNTLNQSQNNCCRFSINEWLTLAITEITKAHQKNYIPIIVGGTGFYISSLIFGISKIPKINPDTETQLKKLEKNYGIQHMHQILQKYDPESAKIISANDQYRIFRALGVYMQTGQNITNLRLQSRQSFYPKNKFNIIYLKPNREKLYSKINNRFLQMLEEGVINEVASVLQSLKLQNPNNQIALPMIGIKSIEQFIHGLIDKNTMIQKVQQDTRRYAKRQYTWFNKQVALFQQSKLQSVDIIIK